MNSVDPCQELHERIADLERQNADYQMRLAICRRGLEHIGNAPDWSTALKYAHAALIHDIHDGFAKFYFETLEQHNELLRAVAEAAHEYIKYEPISLIPDKYWRLRREAIDGGALEEGE